MANNRRKFLKHLAGLSGLAASSVPAISASATSTSNVIKAASKAQVHNLRLSQKTDYVRLVFELNTVTEHSIFALHKPERLVLDLKNTKMSQKLVDQIQPTSVIRKIRSGIRNNNDLRVVFDLSEKVSPRSFLLPPSGESGHRLVVDLHNKDARSGQAKAAAKIKKRDVVVAIDAGHGGKDPGATGRSGTREKTITLQMAKQVEKLINAQYGMKAVLIRKTDRFVHLRDRVKKARDSNADMMISIHADSFPDPRAQGSSVYALSVGGASSETARLLADKENAADLLFGDIKVAVKDKMVNEVLLDLSLTGTIESSLDIGGEILSQIKSINSVHKKEVQQAEFSVLKAPNIPSVLIETAFISNPREEKKLRSASHQKKVAKAITRGVSKYFARKAPPGTWLAEAQCQYNVCEGDSLISIAKLHNVSERALQHRNAIFKESLIAGQTIYIPMS